LIIFNIILIAAIAAGLFYYFGQRNPERKTVLEEHKLTKQDILEKSKQAGDVQKFMSGSEYIAYLTNLTEKDIKESPALYANLSLPLYKVEYSKEKYGLIVIMDNERILKILPVTKLSLG
jgi:hypothetical protein